MSLSLWNVAKKHGFAEILKNMQSKSENFREKTSRFPLSPYPSGLLLLSFYRSVQITSSWAHSQAIIWLFKIGPWWSYMGKFIESYRPKTRRYCWKNRSDLSYSFKTNRVASVISILQITAHWSRRRAWLIHSSRPLLLPLIAQIPQRILFRTRLMQIPLMPIWVGRDHQTRRWSDHWSVSQKCGP